MKYARRHSTTDGFSYAVLIRLASTRQGSNGIFPFILSKDVFCTKEEISLHTNGAPLVNIFLELLRKTFSQTRLQFRLNAMHLEALLRVKERFIYSHRLNNDNTRYWELYDGFLKCYLI